MSNKPFPYTTDPAAIPTQKLTCVRDGSVYYQCPKSCWDAHMDGWRKAYRTNKQAPVPMVWGHLMFDEPRRYAKVPYGCTDATVIRAAHEADVRAVLHGWDRGLPPDKLDAIVNATVDARMKGNNLGAFPFVACIMASAEGS